MHKFDQIATPQDQVRLKSAGQLVVDWSRWDDPDDDGSGGAHGAADDAWAEDTDNDDATNAARPTPSAASTVINRFEADGKGSDLVVPHVNATALDEMRKSHAVVAVWIEWPWCRKCDWMQQRFIDVARQVRTDRRKGSDPRQGSSRPTSRARWSATPRTSWRRA